VCLCVCACVRACVRVCVCVSECVDHHDFVNVNGPMIPSVRSVGGVM